MYLTLPLSLLGPGEGHTSPGLLPSTGRRGRKRKVGGAESPAGSGGEMGRVGRAAFQPDLSKVCFSEEAHSREMEQKCPLPSISEHLRRIVYALDSAL